MVLTRGSTGREVEVVVEKSLVVVLVLAADSALVGRVLGTTKAFARRQELIIIVTKINRIPVRIWGLLGINIEGNMYCWTGKDSSHLTERE
jgi:hypothetical protein